MCARKMSPTTVCSRTECAVVTPGFAVTRCTCRGDGVKPACEEKLTFSQIYSCTCSDGSESGEETAAQLVGTGRTSCTEQLVGLDHSWLVDQRPSIHPAGDRTSLEEQIMHITHLNFSPSSFHNFTSWKNYLQIFFSFSKFYFNFLLFVAQFESAALAPVGETD